MVVQQVDFINVQQSPVCGCQNPRFKMAFAFLDRFFNIKRSNYPVFGRGYWKINKRNLAGDRFKVIFIVYLFLHPIGPGGRRILHPGLERGENRRRRENRAGEKRNFRRARGRRQKRSAEESRKNNRTVGRHLTGVRKSGFAPIGIFFPVVIFGFIFGLNYLLLLIDVAKFYLDLQTHILISLAANVIPIRYYFVNLKFDKTGRGVLLFTFVMILIFFAIKDFVLEL